MENLVALFTAAIALMGSPGPATLSSAAAGAAFGRRALPYVVGLTSGTFTVMLLVAAGVAGLMASAPGAAPVITALAAAYFLYLAWKIATAPPVGTLEAQAAAPSWLAGWLLGIANPKAWGAMGALFSGFVLIPGDPLAGNALKVALLAPFALAVNTGWMTAGAALARAMHEPRTSRALNIGFAVLLLVSVAAMVPW